MRRALFLATLLLVLAPVAVAQVVPVGAAQAAAVAMRTYTLEEILVLTSQSGTVQAGTATLRGGATFPVFVGAAVVAGALAWLYNQANNAAHPALDAYNNYGQQGAFPTGFPAYVTSGCSEIGTSGQLGYKRWCYNGNAYSYVCVPWGGASGTDTISDYGDSGGRRTAPEVYAQMQGAQSCMPYTFTASARPALSDWIRGTYTPIAGQTAVPHPEVIDEINRGIRGYVGTVPMPTPAGGGGITIGAPSPTQDVWEDGCPSGSDWNGTNCSAPDPATQPCQAGYYRPFVGGGCVINPNPEPACPSGLYRPYAGATCQVPAQDCAVGYSRPNLGGACAPDPVAPAPIATNCPGMVGGDGVVGFVTTFYPNIVALTKCMFVPTRDIPSRVNQLAAVGKTRFPFSVATQLQAAFVAPTPGGADAVLPTNAGFFTLDWGWLAPFWSLAKLAIGSMIHFSALWFIWGKLNPQVVI